MSQLPHVNILLSTYNGEQYLAQQLDSLLAQTYPNITIYIRDDGSNDHTMSIITRYHSKNRDKIILLNDTPASNLGYMQSFWTLLRDSRESDYYAFCDQDDIWHPDKIKLGVCALEKEEEKLPLLYTSSYDYYDENLQFIGDGPKIPNGLRLKDTLFYTYTAGFTIIVNHILKEMALETLSLTCIPHDNWCQKIALSMGKLIYDSTPTAKYRRHSSTATYSTSSKLILITNWLKNDVLGQGLSSNRFVIKRFYEEYRDRICISDRKALEIFMEQPFSMQIYLKRLFYPKRLRPSLGGELALRLCFLMNK